MKNEEKQNRSRVYGAFGALVAGLAGSAHAAVPAEVTTAFTDLSADVVTVGGLVLVATVGVMVFKYIQATII